MGPFAATARRAGAVLVLSLATMVLMRSRGRLQGVGTSLDVVGGLGRGGPMTLSLQCRTLFERALDWSDHHQSSINDIDADRIGRALSRAAPEGPA